MRKGLNHYIAEGKDWRRVKTYSNLADFIEEYTIGGRICTTGLRKLLPLIKSKRFWNKLTFDEKTLVLNTLWDWDHPDFLHGRMRSFPCVDWEKCTVMLLAEIYEREGSLDSIFKEENIP